MLKLFKNNLLTIALRTLFFRILRGCLVCVFKQPFSVFKQHFTYFYILFHPHVFPQVFSNNNFQFLNTCTKRTLSIFNTYKGRDENVFFKETYNGIYSKKPNFWISNIGFEPFKLTLIFS